MKLVTIDLLRSIAAIFILLFHYTFRYMELYSSNNKLTFYEWPLHIKWGFGAIATFFILSGFLTSHYFTNQRESTLKYLVNRFFRLYPTFWLCLLITSLILLFTNHFGFSIKTFILNLTMIPGCFKADYIDGAYWTMQMEFFFSFIIAIVALFNRSNFKLVILTLWMAITLIFNITDPTTNNLLIRILRIFFMPNYSAYFISGISIYQVIFNEKSNKFLFATLIVASTFSCFLVNSFNALFIFYLLTVAILFIIKPVEALLNKHKLICSILSYIALISYPLYLAHQVIGYAIINYLLQFGIKTELVIIVPITIIVIIATLIHFFFENPVYRLKSKLLKNLM